MAETTTTEVEAEDEADTRRMDEEIKTVAGILRTLSRMDEKARQRVIAYLAARFVAE